MLFGTTQPQVNWRRQFKAELPFGRVSWYLNNLEQPFIEVHLMQDSLKQRFKAMRAHSLAICAPLQKEDFVVQPAIDVSPPKWHLAHSTWFWEEFVLAKYAAGYKHFHPKYSFLFNSYYTSLGDRVLRMDRGNMSRPTVDEIMDYRGHVDHHMEAFLKNTSEELVDLIELGLNHEQQHQELLLTDIKFIFGHNPLFPVYQKDFLETTRLVGETRFKVVQEGMYQIGFEGNGFSFDNENNRHQVFLSGFSVRKNLVSNEEFLAFMLEGGYENSLLWHSDGWAWVQANKVYAPLYWQGTNDEWTRYALSGMEKINPLEPVTHISFYEASAFAEWCGMRLPTEFEWEAAADELEWGERWEHTASAYLPYPGFNKQLGAIGEYNAKFMVNQMVLRGASIATPHAHSRKSYRNFFHPHLRWQFNGIRLCKRK